MKDYPSIPYVGESLPPGEFWYVFDKLDGSNIRAEWRRGKGQGAWRFGRRRGLLDDSNPFLPEAESLIRDGFCDPLEQVFRDNQWQRATAFFEFRGDQSFAGYHQNESHRVALLDVFVFKKGMLEPRKFLKLFGHLQIPKLLYSGQLDRQERAFIKRVMVGSVEGITSEGVVFKSGRFERKLGRPLMFKVKTERWRERLREFVAGDEFKYKALL